MSRDYREYEHFDKIIYVYNFYWRCGFYDDSGLNNNHYLIGIDYPLENEWVLPYNEHTRQYVGKNFTGEETEKP